MNSLRLLSAGEHADAATPKPESRALGPVAVRGPVGVALAARLLVAGRARRHAAADAAALEARPGAPVLARLRAAPHVARAPAVCIRPAGRRSTEEIFCKGSGDAREQTKIMTQNRG